MNEPVILHESALRRLAELAHARESAQRSTDSRNTPPRATPDFEQDEERVTGRMSNE